LQFSFVTFLTKGGNHKSSEHLSSHRNNSNKSPFNLPHVLPNPYDTKHNKFKSSEASQRLCVGKHQFGVNISFLSRRRTGLDNMREKMIVGGPP